MRCTYEGCEIYTKSPKQRKCWREWQLCAVHANQLHPEEYDHRYAVGWINKEGRFGS